MEPSKIIKTALYAPVVAWSFKQISYIRTFKYRIFLVFWIGTDFNYNFLFFFKTTMIKLRKLCFADKLIINFCWRIEGFSCLTPLFLMMNFMWWAFINVSWFQFWRKLFFYDWLLRTRHFYFFFFFQFEISFKKLYQIDQFIHFVLLKL